MKQVILVRDDLVMSKGKLACQVAHASISAAVKADPETQSRWITENQKKVVLKVDSLEHLVRLYEFAIYDILPTAIVMDAGRTELRPGTITTVGIGPAADVLIDNITGDLKLL